MVAPVRRIWHWFRSESGRELLAYLGCLLSPLLFLGRPLLQGRVLLAADLLEQFWPYRDLWAGYIGEGILPLWNPYLFSGMPFLGDPQFAVLYPLNLLFLILPSLTAIQVHALSGYALLAAFAYYYLRTLRQSRLAGLCAALSLTYGLYLVAHIPHLTLVQTIVWLPLQLALTERLVATRQARYTLLLAIVLALQVYSGHPQFLFYSALLLGGYQLLHLIFVRRGRGSLAVRLGVAWLAGIMLGAVQLLPALELAMLSPRQALAYEQFSAYSLPPVMLIQLVAPFFFGTFSDIVYQLQPFVVGWSWEVVSYAGALPIVCLVSLATIRRWAGWREAFWWGVLVWGIVFALGDNTALYGLVYRIPVYNWFRVAGRHLFLVSLALAIIAGFRVEHLLRADRRKMAGTLAYFVMVTTLLVVLVAVREADVLRVHYGAGSLAPGLFLPLLTFGSLFLVLWPFGDGAQRQRRPRRLLLIGLVAVDLLLTSSTVVPSLPRSEAESRQTEFETLARVLPDDGQRLWHLTARHWGNNYLFARLPSATSYNPLIVERYAQLSHVPEPTGASFLLQVPREARERLLDLLDVGYLLVPREMAAGSWLDTTCARQIQGYCFSEPVGHWPLLPGAWFELPLPTGEKLTGLGLISALGDALDVPDRTPVAELRLLDDGDRVQFTTSLLAGVHSADWAADRLPAGQDPGHSLPPTAASRAPVWIDGSAYEGQSYFSWIEVEAGDEPVRLVIQNTSADSLLLLDSLSLELEAQRTVGYRLARGLYATSLPPRPPDWIAGRFAVYHRRPAWGHAWSVGRVQALDSTAFLQELDAPDLALDLGRVAYVDQADLPGYLQTWPDLLEAGFDSRATVETIDRGPNALGLRVRSETTAFVVLSEVYYPGWQARIDGEWHELLRVDHALRGLVVPAGAHEVDVVYRPRLVYWGLALGLLALGLLIAFGYLFSGEGVSSDV